MILGIDVSTYLEELEHGARYRDGGCQIDPLDAFRENGVDYMRIRVWNDPKSADGAPYLAGNCDIAHYIRLAALAKSKGYRLLMDFHYSDFWADPGKQMIPKAWADHGIDEMTEALYEFTRSCLEAAAAAGVAPEMVQIGNEITNGMLWPVGRLEQPDGSRGNYENFCRLVDAGCRACRQVLPEAKIVLHLERSNDKAVYQEFFTQMEGAGIDYDIIGASYYPYWHGPPPGAVRESQRLPPFWQGADGHGAGLRLHHGKLSAGWVCAPAGHRRRACICAGLYGAVSRDTGGTGCIRAGFSGPCPPKRH